MSVGNNTNKYEECPPNADAMVESIRAVGYGLEMAVADIIDNSISAGAKNIYVTQNWSGANSYISILDDGRGMNENTLFEAMRLGSRNPLEERDPTDLGRFGLGMKTASFSQCRLMTVRSKTAKGELSTRCWDLDYINDVKEWHLLKSNRDENECLLTPLDNVKSGTIVLWQILDRVVEEDDPESEQGKEDFLRKIDNLQKYLEMVFHRYIGFGGKVNIYINSPESMGEEYTKIKAWDPFMEDHKATQHFPLERFKKKIEVTSFVLPHISKLSPKEFEEGGGTRGWNLQQGFYIYRKKRLIIAGGWLDLGCEQEIHYKLARIRVDITNEMDKEWKIDVKKAVAHPPDVLRKDLSRIAKLIRTKATEVYRYRGKVTRRQKDTTNKFIWKKIDKRGKVSYCIDRKHPLISEITGKLKDAKKDINILFKLIESTVPVPQIVLENSENPDSYDTSDITNEYAEIIKELFWDQVEMQKNRGLGEQEAKDFVLSMEPFDQCPELMAELEG